MLNIGTLIQEIVSTYQIVPELLEAVDGEEAAIYFWLPTRPDTPNYDDVLDKMAWPSLLVSHIVTELGYRGNITQWRHTFRVDIKIMGDVVDYPTVIKALVDGIPGGPGGLTLMQCSFDDLVDSMEAVVVTRQISAEGKYFYRVEFALQEKGGMG